LSTSILSYTYEGIPRSVQPLVLIVVVTPSKQSPSTFSNVNSISATIGTDFWTCVVQSIIIPEVQKYPGNNALVGAISFSKKRIIHRQIRHGEWKPCS